MLFLYEFQVSSRTDRGLRVLMCVLAHVPSLEPVLRHSSFSLYLYLYLYCSS